MLHTRLAAAQGVASKLYLTENSLDTTVMALADLLAAMPLATREMNVSPVVGHACYAEASAALAALIDARDSMMRLHERLQETRVGLGLAERSMGDMWKLNEPPKPNGYLGSDEDSMKPLELVRALAA
jgi:hypothetical protein